MKRWPTSSLAKPCGAALAVGLALNSAAQSAHSGFVWLDANRIDQLATDVGHQPHDAWVWRNEAGTRLFLDIPAHGGTLVQIVSEHGSETNWVAGGRPVVTDEGKPICYMDEHALVFADGHRIPMTEASWFDFCPSREYFFFRDGTNRAAVFRTAAPEKQLIQLPGGFLPQSIFFHSNSFFLFGDKVAPGRTGLKGWGLVFSNDGPGFVLKKEINLSRFGGVLDMDTNGGLLLVQGKGDIMRSWGLYDPDTGRYESRGLCRGYGFFLEENFRKYLEGRWKEK